MRNTSVQNCSSPNVSKRKIFLPSCFVRIALGSRVAGSLVGGCQRGEPRARVCQGEDEHDGASADESGKPISSAIPYPHLSWPHVVRPYRESAGCEKVTQSNWGAGELGSSGLRTLRGKLDETDVRRADPKCAREPPTRCDRSADGRSGTPPGLRRRYDSPGRGAVPLGRGTVAS